MNIEFKIQCSSRWFSLQNINIKHTYIPIYSIDHANASSSFKFQISNHTNLTFTIYNVIVDILSLSKDNLLLNSFDHYLEALAD